LKYIHHYFFSKISNEKITVRLMGREIWYFHIMTTIRIIYALIDIIQDVN